MKPVTVGRYSKGDYEVVGGDPVPSETPYFNGWIETEDWIVFEAHDGALWVHHGRDESGAVIGPPMVVGRGDSN